MRIRLGSHEDAPNGLIMVFGLVHGDAKELRQLRRGNNDCGGVCEAIDDRVRQEVDEHAQSQETEEELKHCVDAVTEVLGSDE